MLIEQLKTFLDDQHRDRTWLTSPELEVYVRKTRRILPDSEQREDFLDIANMQAYPEGQGAFTKFITEAETVTPFSIYVEGVPNPRFRKFFERRGYVYVPRTDPPCLVLKKRI